jgi:hypothetical protein
MDQRLRQAIRRQEDATVEETISGAAAQLNQYGLDPSGDFDIADIDASHVLALQQRLAEDPEGVLAEARTLWDSEISETELKDALEKTRAYIERPELGSGALESVQALEAAVGVPSGFGFDGYDPAMIPILPQDTKFETVADAAGYATSFIGAKLANALKPKPPFPVHTAAAPFVYDYQPTATTIGLLADFGNGLAHSRYIAKHLRATKLDHLLYLGDVYYCGTSRDYADYVAPEIEQFLNGDVVGGNKVNVLMLNSNHEMFSKGYSYFSYLKYRLAKGKPQVQQGSYFALRFGNAMQLIAIDTDYGGYGRFRDPNQTAWLRQRLAEGRANGAFNILVSANEPFAYGKNSTTKLYDDLKSFLPSVDLWLWGNTHYCGLFNRTATLPVSTCLGHGGYPYKLAEYRLDKNPYMEPCPASPLFLEMRPRYYGTKLRSDVGNNGYAIMTLDPANQQVRLDYMDWMKRRRYRALIGKSPDGRGVFINGEEDPTL